MTDPTRRFSPAAERNRQPILEVLRRVLPARGRALEIASGSGQHVSWFAHHLRDWTWQPTDFDADALPSIRAWSVEHADDAFVRSPQEGDTGRVDRVEQPLPNVLAPVRLDVCADDWPVAGEFDAITCTNMLHASPPATLPGLMHGVQRHLAADGLLVTYGPYLLDDRPTAPSNLEFDAWLKTRDPSWGIRRLADVVAEGERRGLRLRERVDMPSNNMVVVFARAATGAA